jgi:hypothetical protein
LGRLDPYSIHRPSSVASSMASNSAAALASISSGFTSGRRSRFTRPRVQRSNTRSVSETTGLF